MSKTPEELAHYYADRLHERTAHSGVFVEGFVAGYQAGRSNNEAVQAAAPQWISVKDRLPELNKHNYSDDVLMLGKYGIEITHIEKTKRIVRWKGLQEVVETNNGSSIDEYTHWMPLPKPPEDAKE
jgi:hypothetical protein